MRNPKLAFDAAPRVGLRGLVYRIFDHDFTEIDFNTV